MSDSGRRFIKSERGQQYLRNIYKAHPDNTVRVDVYENRNGRFQKCGEKKVHVNEIIAKEVNK